MHLGNLDLRNFQFLYMVDSFMMGYAGFIYLRAWHNSCVYLAAAGGGEASRTKAL